MPHPVLSETSIEGATRPTSPVEAAPLNAMVFSGDTEFMFPAARTPTPKTKIFGVLVPVNPVIAALVEPQAPAPHAPMPQPGTMDTVIDGVKLPVPPKATAPARSLELSSGVVLMLPVADTPVVATVVLRAVLPTALVSATPVSAVVWATIPTEPLILGIGPVPASSMR